MKVGDKVTICETGIGGSRYPVGVTTVAEVGKRFMRTEDGRRWQVKGIFQAEANARGAVIGTAIVREYKDGDEQKAERTGLLLRARRLLRGQIWQIERDFALLDNEDLKTLAEISDRLDAARAVRS